MTTSVTNDTDNHKVDLHSTFSNVLHASACCQRCLQYCLQPLSESFVAHLGFQIIKNRIPH